MILQGANAAKPCPYNGSVIMFRAGTHQELWDELRLDAVYRIPKYEFPDDQGWICTRCRTQPDGRSGRRRESMHSASRNGRRMINCRKMRASSHSLGIAIRHSSSTCHGYSGIGYRR